MKRAFIMIKKFFSIILSFILGIFYKKEGRGANVVKQDKAKEEEVKVSEKLKQYQRNQEEQSSENKRERQDYYLKKDLERIYYALQKIERIEYQLKITTDERTLETMKAEIKIIKQDLRFLDEKYKKVDSNQGDIKSLTIKLYACKELVEKVEKKIEKINDAKNSSNEKESSTGNSNTEIKKEEQLLNLEKLGKKASVTQTEEKEKNLPEINKDQLLADIVEYGTIEESNKIIRAKHHVIEIQVSSSEHSNIDNNIFDNIIIKDIPKDLIENRRIHNTNNNQKKVNKKEEVSHVRENTLKKQNKPIAKENRENKPKVIRKVRSSSVKKYSVNLLSMKQRISTLKNHSKLRTISSSIKKALTLGRNSSQFLEQHLMVNNYIRKARRMNNRKVKPLKYRKVFKLESNLKKQTSYIMTDTLRQIQLLRTEIYSQYDLTAEIKKILDELNEIELEVRMSLNQASQKEEERSKFR